MHANTRTHTHASTHTHTHTHTHKHTHTHTHTHARAHAHTHTHTHTHRHGHTNDYALSHRPPDYSAPPKRTHTNARAQTRTSSHSHTGPRPLSAPPINPLPPPRPPSPTLPAGAPEGGGTAPLRGQPSLHSFVLLSFAGRERPTGQALQVSGDTGSYHNTQVNSYDEAAERS